VRTAFEKSLNIPAVSLVNQMGVQASVSYINKFGIATEAGDNYLPVALGS
jgi:membrane carboxypeptidase/penicillin-binding protein